MPEEAVKAPLHCRCEACKRKRKESSKIVSGTIHGYTSQPSSGWVARHTRSEIDDMNSGAHMRPTFGVELETLVAPPPLRNDFPEAAPVRPTAPAHSDEYNRITRGYIAAQSPEEGRALDAEYDVVLAEENALSREYEELLSTFYSDREAWRDRQEAWWETQRAAQLDEAPMTAEEAVSVVNPVGLWHPKHDGSVSGPEFASQPATLAYWRSARPAVADMFTNLLHGGMRSHDGDQCGLHINIGTGAFSGLGVTRSATHLRQFAALVADNATWSRRMSQRTKSSESHWAPFHPLSLPDHRARWAEEWARYGYASQDRYCVINAGNEHRVEFRLPRGTLRIDRFYAKLEWVAAMVEYTRTFANATTSKAFMSWVYVRREEYPELAAFMGEKFPLIFGEVL